MQLLSLAYLAGKNLLNENEITTLKAVRKYNALLFDFLLKRRVNIRKDYFDATVFQTRPFFQTTTGYLWQTNTVSCVNGAFYRFF